MDKRYRHTVINGRPHQHAARLSDRRTAPYERCVQDLDGRKCRPAAHYGEQIYDRCGCGAERWSNHRRTGEGMIAAEYGPWTYPHAAPPPPQGNLFESVTADA